MVQNMGHLLNQAAMEGTKIIEPAYHGEHGKPIGPRCDAGHEKPIELDCDGEHEKHHAVMQGVRKLLGPTVI